MNHHPSESLTELLRQRAAGQSASRGFTFLVNGEAEGDRLTYADLDRRSQQLAARLQGAFAPGDRVLLLYGPGLDFITAFFGCLYAEVVAVPTYPPHPVRPSQSLPRLQAIAAEAGIRAVLTTEAVAVKLRGLFARVPLLAGLPVLATDREEATGAWREPRVDAHRLAFLQYTSGSTAAPKGVMLSHANLLHNLAYIRDRAALGTEGVIVSWLPAHHDMGLLGGVLLPLFAGIPSYLMAPVSFVQKPARWLHAVSRYRAVFSGGPNFAYDLCVHKTTPEQRQGLDLRCWQVAYNGAEPIRRETLAAFQRTFEPHGLRRTALCPVYGLSEATSLVSNSRLRAETPPGSMGVTDAFVSCGRPAAHTEVVIADPQTQVPVSPGAVGEIWIANPSVGQGYWNRPEETEATFRACLADTGRGPFLRTGDLGLLRDGELFVTGRIKDVIIIRGRKHYPQDLEQTIEASHPAVRPNSSAAVSLPTPEGERLLVLVEVSPRHRARTVRPSADQDNGQRELDDLIGSVRQAMAEQHELQTHVVALVPLGAIPRTTSGKLQRHACRERFLNGTLETIAQWPRPAAMVISSLRMEATR